MPTFRDNLDRPWSIHITIGAIRRVRAALKVDLVSVVDPGPGLLARLADDPVLLVDVVYVLCREQAKDAGVSDVEFGEAMAGEALAHAADALAEGIVDFFPPGRRRLLQAALRKAQTISQASQTTAAILIESIPLMPPIAAPPVSGDGSGNSPASSASTPAT